MTEHEDAQAKGQPGQNETDSRFLGVSQGAWANVGRVAALITLLGGVVWIGGVIWGHQTGPNLHGEFRASVFQWPPAFTRDVSTLCSRIVSATTPDSLVKYEVPEAKRVPLARHVRAVVTPFCQGFNQNGPYRYVQTLYTGSITNNGTETAKSVSLRVPSPSMVVVRREGAEPVVTLEKEVVDIGTIRPNEPVTVSVWTTIPAYGSAGYNPASNELKLISAGKGGSVTILSFTSPFLQGVYARIGHTPLWLWLVYITSLALVVFGIMALITLATGKVFVHEESEPTASNR